MAYTSSHYTDSPTSWNNQCEVMDYLEIRCITDGKGEYSTMSAFKAATIIDDEESDSFEDALIDYDDRIYDLISETVNYELDYRHEKSGGKYPFSTDGDSITLNDDVVTYVRDVYIFLLLCTRLRMGGEGCNRVHNGFDGTQLFEQLCAKVLQNYFGEHSLSFVFGTGADDDNQSFKAKLKELLKHIGEKNNCIATDINNKQKDGGVDVVLYIPFADGREGKLIAFAQCKTGHGWREKVSANNSQVFMRKFLGQSPTFTPVNVFMVAESFNDRWRDYQLNSNGVLFDRSRIMEFLPDMTTAENRDLYEKIIQWKDAAIKSVM